MYFSNQFSIYIIGSAATGATLTTAYSGNTHTDDVRGYQLATLYVEYTPGENTSDCYVQLEAGPDSSNLFPKVALLEEDTSGESVTKSHIFKIDGVAAGTAVKRRFLVELADIKLRTSVKETTPGTAGTVKVILTRHEQIT